jgi:5-methylcytosine-specific restriction protein A
VELAAAVGGRATVKLTALKPRLATIPGRLQMAATLSTQRLRGRAAVNRRADYLRLHPLCVECEKHGRVSAATVPDHIQPLWAGGPDDLEANGQALCTEHHDAKTACEARMRAAAGWLSTPCQCGRHAHGTA